MMYTCVWCYGIRFTTLIHDIHIVACVIAQVNDTRVCSYIIPIAVIYTIPIARCHLLCIHVYMYVYR